MAPRRPRNIRASLEAGCSQSESIYSKVLSRKTIVILGMAGTLWNSLAATAESVVYDFVGSGFVCTYTGLGTNQTCLNPVFSGTISLEVLAEGPSGPDGSTNGSTEASDLNGWVQSDFLIQWDGNSFNPEPVPEQNYADSAALVNNDYTSSENLTPVDALVNRERYAAKNSASFAYRDSFADMVRITMETSWLDDLRFDVSATLAPGSDSTNVIVFENVFIDFEKDFFDGQYSGFFGRIDLSSLTIRDASSMVDIDIRPRATPNRINPNKNGRVRVAVLGSTTFDATQLDVSTVAFGPDEASPIREGQVRDADNDGFLDMVLAFRIRDTGLACGDTSATLTATTFNGTAISAMDSIKTVGCKKKRY
jgi:hypothetical protein